jgi:hypothetical protein
LGKRSTPGSQVVSAAFGRGASSRIAPLWRHPAAGGPPWWWAILVFAFLRWWAILDLNQ